MSKQLRILFGLTVLVALILAPALQGAQDEIVLHWQTSAGSSVNDQGAAIAVDPSGNIYLAGWSDATWGSPINPHSGGRDAFVARLNRNGGIEWNTFVGSSDYDEAKAIAVDRSGNVYVVGFSRARWGIPGVPFRGDGAFVAKLNSNGALQWNRFMTPEGSQRGEAVAVDTNGDVYVGGWGGTSGWATPPNATQVGGGSFVARLDSSGKEVWHAFFLGTGYGGLQSLAVDVSGNVYAAGRSEATWGNPVNPYSGGQDAFVAKLNSNGAFQWNTFMGSSGSDGGADIALDGSGNVYVAGTSEANWGTPINPRGEGDAGAFAAKLDSSGVRQWHTFLGGIFAWAIAADGGQNVYVAGTWGFVAALNRDGVLQGNILLNANLQRIALDGSGNVYVAGQNDGPWGTPVNPWAGGWDAFVAKIGQPGFASVSAASFIPAAPLAPRSIAAGFGQGLAPLTESATVVPLPTTLAETSVRVQDSQDSERLAPLFFVSPGQINYLVPEGTAVGQATVRVVSRDVMVSVGTLTVAYVSPGVFTANSTGDGVVAAVGLRVKSDGTQQEESLFQYDSTQRKYVPLAIDPGADTDQVFLLLFGTGIRNRSSLDRVKVRLGGVDAEVRYAGEQGSFVGLDQLNVLLPRVLSGRGEVDVELSVDGTEANVGIISVGGRLLVPPPEITSLSPDRGVPGQAYSLVITGRNLDGTTKVEFTPSTGITVGGTVASATTVTSQLTIASAASPGAYTVSVLSSTGRSNKKIFTISSPAPQISSLSKTSGYQGQTISSFTISGQYLSGVTAIQFTPSAGVTVSNISASASQVTATVTISSSATAGSYNVKVSSPAGTSNAVAFTVQTTAPVPQITTLNPSTGQSGQTFSLTIAGTNLSGVTAVQFTPSAGITVSNISASASQVTATVTISSSATAGSYNVKVSSPAGTSNAVAFAVSQTTNYSGTWSGTTNQGRTMSFTISNNVFTQFTIGVNYPYLGYGCPSSSTTTGSASAPITGNTFSASGLYGSFSSPTAASGSFSWRLSIPGCSASGQVQWTATKQ